uniref:Growth arrest specific 2 like 1 n=1 Tax=Petromyzon marinus TaxID=7757 RepID=S4REC7_PETMA
KSIRPFRSSEEYLYAMKEDLAEWLSALHSLDITVDNFLEELETGTVLCHHANTVNRQAAEFAEAQPQAAATMQVKMRRVFFNGGGGTVCYQRCANIQLLLQWIDKRGNNNYKLPLGRVEFVLAVSAQTHPAQITTVGYDGYIARIMIIHTKDNTANQLPYFSCCLNPPPPPPRPSSPQMPCITHQNVLVRFLLSRCTCPVQFPMVRVSEGKYRVGDSSSLIYVRQILRKHVMVRVGGGWDTLEHYLDKHDPCRCLAPSESLPLTNPPLAPQRCSLTSIKGWGGGGPCKKTFFCQASYPPPPAIQIILTSASRPRTPSLLEQQEQQQQTAKLRPTRPRSEVEPTPLHSRPYSSAESLTGARPDNEQVLLRVRRSKDGRHAVTRVTLAEVAPSARRRRSEEPLEDEASGANGPPARASPRQGGVAADGTRRLVTQPTAAAAINKYLPCAPSMDRARSPVPARSLAVSGTNSVKSSRSLDARLDVVSYRAHPNRRSDPVQRDGAWSPQATAQLVYIDEHGPPGDRPREEEEELYRRLEEEFRANMLNLEVGGTRTIGPPPRGVSDDSGMEPVGARISVSVPAAQGDYGAVVAELKQSSVHLKRVDMDGWGSKAPVLGALRRDGTFTRMSKSVDEKEGVNGATRGLRNSMVAAAAEPIACGEERASRRTQQQQARQGLSRPRKSLRKPERVPSIYKLKLRPKIRPRRDHRPEQRPSKIPTPTVY